MNRMRKLLALLMALGMIFSLVACGNSDSEETAAPTEPPVSEVVAATEVPQETETEETGTTLYTITVVDEAGNPVIGAMVQMCKDSCLPGPATDAEGKTRFSLAADTYKVSFIVVPVGYTYVDDVTEFYFEDGATEMTITLKTAE